MPRKGYISIQLDDEVNKVFTLYCTLKGLSKSTVLSRMIDTYMLAADEETYIYAKKQVNNVDRFKELAKIKDLPDEIEHVLLKLPVNGDACDSIVQKYCKCISVYGHTWMSSPFPNLGINAKMVDKFNSSINRGLNIKLFLYDSKVADITYSADLMEVWSKRTKSACPGDIKTIPKDYLKSEDRTWLKICNLKKDRSVSVRDLQFSKKGSDLSYSLAVSGMLLGYVKLNGESGKQ